MANESISSGLKPGSGSNKKREDKALPCGAAETTRFAQSVLDTLSAHIAVLDETGTIVAVNQSWHDFAQANPPVQGNLAEGANYLTVCLEAEGPDSEGAAEFARGLQALIGGEQDRFSLEYPCHSSSEKRWFMAIATRFSENGKIHVVVSHENITKRKEMETQLIRAREEWERTFDALPDLVTILDERHRIVRINQAMARRLGRTPQELVGQTCYTAVHGAGSPPDFCPHTRLLAGAAGQSAEFYEDRLEGHFHVSVSPILNADGKLIGSVHVARDITARKQMEDELRRSRDELEERVQKRTAELGRLSTQLINVQEEERSRISRELHDSVGQSLAAIKFSAESALSHIRNKKMDAGVRALEALIPLSQQTSDEVRRIHTDLRPSLIDDLGIASTLTWFCREFERIYSGISIEREVAVEERAISEPLKIVIFRVLQEALNNVAKHGGAQAHLVRVSLRGRDSRLELAVEDNGKGFIVEQALALKSRQGGFGLTSMKERTELSGGSFAIDSSPGTGTVLRASWPMVK